jgi:hypothetical protein
MAEFDAAALALGALDVDVSDPPLLPQPSAKPVTASAATRPVTRRGRMVKLITVAI